MSAMEGHGMGRVVVGVDGSAESAAALRLAEREAAWRNADLEVVHVYAPPRVIERHQAHAWSDALLWPGIAPDDDMPGGRYDSVAGSARSSALAFLRRFVFGLGVDPDAVALTVLAGRRPARCLLRIAETADLLVVGASRHRGFAVLRSRSVGRQCSGQATCQLLIADHVAVAA